jgi:hypothetical protein
MRGVIASMLMDALTSARDAAEGWGKHHLEWKAHDTGTSIDLSARMTWWNEFLVASVPNQPREDRTDQLDHAMNAVNAFVDEAQDWPEAREMVAAWRAVSEFSKSDLRDVILARKLSPTLFVAPGCLGCGLDEHGASKARAA